jgi:hypothetical protein
MTLLEGVGVVTLTTLAAGGAVSALWFGFDKFPTLFRRVRYLERQRTEDKRDWQDQIWMLSKRVAKLEAKA